jgi:hypothetical protein
VTSVIQLPDDFPLPRDMAFAGGHMALGLGQMLLDHGAVYHGRPIASA